MAMSDKSWTVLSAWVEEGAKIYERVKANFASEVKITQRSKASGNC